ncbi:purine permease 3 [Lathyrus oleraceus]|uniref:Probable purine permease n=1 Tax=Pisum sativum TaxID=3888 RepID=A0A9D4Y9V5_PEA|nr:purine permease 3-like [Pisum sativum]KAI5435673.1 hypothetical protein KIW84_022190 [Pisum sativum]
MVERISQEKEEENERRSMKKLLLILNSILLAIGTCGGPLVMRLYFIHGGNRVWLSSFLETSAFPIILIPLTISHIHNRYNNPNGPNTFVSMKSPLFFASAVIGILTGLDDYLYACGIKRLPVSTSSLIQSSHLAFTAVFAFLVVKHKFTAYSVNSIVLLTLGSVVLALNSKGGDRLVGESSKEYVIGFVMILASAALYGFVLPLMELVYKKSKQVISYSLVMEIQLVMCFFATLFCVVGMFIDNDFKVIPREAREFKLGETKYYVVLVWSAIMWQFFFLGVIGVIFCSSSLLSGVIIAAFLPITEVLAVIVYKESFQAEKGVALALSLWGFVSYFYDEIKEARKTKSRETELPQSHHSIA